MPHIYSVLFTHRARCLCRLLQHRGVAAAIRTNVHIIHMQCSCNVGCDVSELYWSSLGVVSLFSAISCSVQHRLMVVAVYLQSVDDARRNGW